MSYQKNGEKAFEEGPRTQRHSQSKYYQKFKHDANFIKEVDDEMEDAPQQQIFLSKLNADSGPIESAESR